MNSGPDVGDFTCIACGNTAPKPLLTSIPFDVKSDRDTVYGQVFRCPDCGLGRVDPLPPGDAIPGHYDLPKYYTQGGSHIPDRAPTLADRVLTKAAYLSDKGTELHAELPRLASGIAVGPGARPSVLDIGCGSGTTLDALQGQGLDLVGVEPDPAARAQAALRGIEVLDGTAEALPPEISGRRFDLILCTHVLEHTLTPEQALRNVAGLLAENGIFYCEVPNAACRHFETFHQISEMLDVPRHLYFFNREALARLAGSAGLEITSWQFHGFTRHHGPNWRAWERDIHARLGARGDRHLVSDHTFWRSAGLMLRSFWRRPEQKYDCIGFFARRAAGG